MARPRRGSLQPLQQLGNRRLRGDQKVNVVGHHHEGMQAVVVKVISPVKDGLHYDAGDLGPSQVFPGIDEGDELGLGGGPSRRWSPTGGKH